MTLERAYAGMDQQACCKHVLAQYAVTCISICISADCVVMLLQCKVGRGTGAGVGHVQLLLMLVLTFLQLRGGVRRELVSVMSFCRRVSQELWELHEGTASGNCHDFERVRGHLRQSIYTAMSEVTGAIWRDGRGLFGL